MDLLKQNRTLVMGILNLTPDSFSDGGRYQNSKDAIKHAYQMLEEGADIIDVGAESTRPGATKVKPREEWQRLEPVLRALTKDGNITVSVDTYKFETALRAMDMGAQIINDVWGGLADIYIHKFLAEDGECHYIYTHNRKEPAEGDGFHELISETKAGIEHCLEVGIKPEKIWIDPGIGFGKTYEQNLTALRRMDEYTKLGYPVLLGTSRKSVIGDTLNLPKDERLEGTLATVALAVQAGVKMVRVHDVLPAVRTCRMVEAIMHGPQNQA